MVTNNLLTVTCTRDLKQMILQAHSIDVFVTTPCTHWVFIDDTDTSEEEWLDLLSPFYTRHTLKLFYNYLRDFNYHGYFRQQLIKLYAVKLIQADYLVLDSKNFFIKSSTLNWDFVEGNGFIRKDIYKETSGMKDFHYFLKDRLDKDIDSSFYMAHTPFRFRKKILKKLLKEVDITRLFEEAITSRVPPFEFHLYRWFSNINLKDYHLPYLVWRNFATTSLTLWWHSQLDEVIPDKIEILGMHRNLYFVRDGKLENLISILVKKGLDQKILDDLINMKWLNRAFSANAYIARDIECNISQLQDFCENSTDLPCVYFSALHPKVSEEYVNKALERYPSLIFAIDCQLFDKFDDVLAQRFNSILEICTDYNKDNILKFYKLRKLIVEEYETTNIPYKRILERYITLEI